LTHSGEKLFLIRLHLLYQRLIAGVFMGVCPEHHLRKNWRQIDSLRREQVCDFACVFWIRFRHDYPVGLQFLQAIRQDIGCDALVTIEEFFVSVRAPQHHVANDQQRPAVAQHLDRSIQWTI
jgi:hypothetical protein